MVSLRRQKLKMKRAGMDPAVVDKCASHQELFEKFKINKPKAEDVGE